VSSTVIETARETAMAGSDTPAISCQNVWQVFGANADSALKQALSQHDTADEVSAALRAQGLVPAVQDANFDREPLYCAAAAGLAWGDPD
jgi:hypothetical protein